MLQPLLRISRRWCRSQTSCSSWLQTGLQSSRCQMDSNRCRWWCSRSRLWWLVWTTLDNNSKRRSQKRRNSSLIYNHQLRVIRCSEHCSKSRVSWLVKDHPWVSEQVTLPSPRPIRSEALLSHRQTLGSVHSPVLLPLKSQLLCSQLLLLHLLLQPLNLTLWVRRQQHLVSSHLLFQLRRQPTHSQLYRIQLLSHKHLLQQTWRIRLPVLLQLRLSRVPLRQLLPTHLAAWVSVIQACHNNQHSLHLSQRSPWSTRLVSFNCNSW